MKSVVICGSRRFAKGIKHLAAEMEKMGAVVFQPEFGGPKELSEMEEKERMKDESYRKNARAAVLAHIERIRKADICFIYNKNGYMGVNTDIEMGVAEGLNKIIYTLEPELPVEEGGETCRSALVTKVVKTPEELFERLK